MTKKSIFYIVLFLAIFSVFVIGETKTTIAGTTLGWLWGGGEYTPEDGSINGNETGLGWVSMSSTNPGVSNSYPYTVTIPDAGGTLSGYAWAGNNIGWVSFNAGDLIGCPSGSCNASMDASGNLSGWARMMQQTNGWIRLAGTTSGGDSYGVTKVATTAGPSFYGYAWSDIFGWIYWGDAKETGCVSNPAMVTFACSKETTNESCDDSANIGKTIIEKQVTCLKTDNCNITYGTTAEDLLACDNAGAKLVIDGVANPCSSIFDEKRTCNYYESWREVAP